MKTRNRKQVLSVFEQQIIPVTRITLLRAASVRVNSSTSDRLHKPPSVGHRHSDTTSPGSEALRRNNKTDPQRLKFSY